VSCCDPIADLPMHLLLNEIVGGTPTLDQVLTAGNTSTLSATVGGLTIDEDTADTAAILTLDGTATTDAVDVASIVINNGGTTRARIDYEYESTTLGGHMRVDMWDGAGLTEALSIKNTSGAGSGIETDFIALGGLIISGGVMIDADLSADATVGISMRLNSGASTGDFLNLKESDGDIVLSINSDFQTVKSNQVPATDDTNNSPYEIVVDIENTAVPAYRSMIASGNNTLYFQSWGTEAGGTTLLLDLGGQLYKAGVPGVGLPYMTADATSTYTQIITYSATQPSPTGLSSPPFWVDTSGTVDIARVRVKDSGSVWTYVEMARGFTP